jgi:uncharacterized membrane protein HdeD (DUF308 family)
MLVTNPFNIAYDLDRASRAWWVLLLNGVITVVAGGIILFADWTLADLAVFVGAVLVIRGLFDMFSVPVDGSGRGWAILLGLLELGLGVVVWAWPAPTLLVISFWLGWYVLFSGVMTISGAIAGRNVIPYWGFMLALGIGEVLLAFWLLARPGTSLVAAVLAIGLWALIAGVTQIIVAIDIKRLRDKGAQMDRGLSDMRRDVHHANA